MRIATVVFAVTVLVVFAAGVKAQTGMLGIGIHGASVSSATEEEGREFSGECTPGPG